MVLDYSVGTLAVFQLPPFKDGISIHSLISILSPCFLSSLVCVPIFVDLSPRHSRSWNRRPPCALFDLSFASRFSSPHFVLCPSNLSHHILSWTTKSISQPPP